MGCEVVAKLCPDSPSTNGAHNWIYSSRTKKDHCSYCSDTRKGNPPPSEGTFDTTRRGTMFGKSATLKGGMWGNKKDKEMSKTRYRENPK